MMTRSRYKMLSDQLRDVIRSCEVSRNELGRQTGVDPAVLSRFLQGKQGLSQATIDALGEYFRLRLVVEDEHVKKQKGR